MLSERILEENDSPDFLAIIFPLCKLTTYGHCMVACCLHGHGDRFDVCILHKPVLQHDLEYETLAVYSAYRDQHVRPPGKTREAVELAR